MTDRHDHRRGFVAALIAYVSWGFLPAYFKAMEAIGPVEIVAHRIVLSLLFVLPLIAFRREWGAFTETLRSWRVIAAMAASAMLILLNWTTYIAAVLGGHILSASLGYFLNPLVSVALGVVVLRERMRPAQAVAVGLAAAGSLILAFTAAEALWVSLLLAITFALYGLVRKVAPVDSLPGLGIETLLLTPLALGYLLWLGATHQLGIAAHADLWPIVIFAGVATSTPLLLFAFAARRMPLTELGLLQYVGPMLQFAVGLFYGERLDLARIASFLVIWAGLAVLTWDVLRQARQRRTVPPT